MRSKIKQLFCKWRGVSIAAFSVAGFTIALRCLGYLQLFEWAALDCFFLWRPVESTDPRIAIVTIDESDIHYVGQWPIPDRILAQLLQKLNSFSPRAIGLDIYRDLPVQPGHEELVEVFESVEKTIGVEKVVGDAYGSAVGAPPTLKELGRIAAADLVLDGDGKVRRALLSLHNQDGQTVLGLGTRLAWMYLEAEGIGYEMTENYSVKLGRALFVRFTGNDGGYVGADTGGYQILLNYRGSLENFETISMEDVLEGRVSPESIRDRIVLIGATAQSLNDLFYTPYSTTRLGIPKRTPGVAVHANIASQILNAALLGRPLLHTWSDPLEWLWILVWSWVGAILAWTWRATRATIYGWLAGLSLAIAISYIAFLYGWWIPAVPPAIALSGSASAITAYIANRERADRQMVMNLFGRHVTPKIAETIWRDRHELLSKGKIVGRSLTATVLFTDLKGFSAIAEQLEPAALMTWLNEYMNAMVELILDHNGVVDKFIGDAVMAVFGVPIPSNTSEEIAGEAIAAVTCAVAMGKKLKALNRKWRMQGCPIVAMRVGISTGTVVAGSLGSSRRMDYTIIGDTVNIAARLESYNKSIDGGVCRILISEPTYQYIRDKFTTECIGAVILKGRQHPEKIYQVLF